MYRRGRGACRCRPLRHAGSLGRREAEVDVFQCRERQHHHPCHLHRRPEVGQAEKRQRPVLGPHEGGHQMVGLCRGSRRRSRPLLRQYLQVVPASVVGRRRRARLQPTEKFLLLHQQDPGLVRYRDRRGHLWRRDHLEMQPAPCRRWSDEILQLLARAPRDAGREHRQGGSRQQYGGRGKRRLAFLSGRHRPHALRLVSGAGCLRPGDKIADRRSRA